MDGASFKKRSKGVRPSGSSSSLRSLAASPGGADGAAAGGSDAGDDDEGNVAVIRRKKTPAGRVKDREGGAGASPKPKSRLSFGGADDGVSAPPVFGGVRTAEPQSAQDEEETTFVKRTDSPRRLLNAVGSTSTRADLPASLDQATISAPLTPAKSIYSKEYLNQLKATSTPPPPSSARGSEYDELTRSKFGEIGRAHV